jgi:uncharacterized membrane protein YphA (DoxX/SURF4 family)
MSALATIGRLFFAVSMAAFGIQQLVFGELVRLAPPLPAWMPWHPFWVDATGVLLLAAGAAIALRIGARWAAAVLAVMLLFDIVLLHLPRALATAGVGAAWTNPCKALAMLGGVLILAAVLPEDKAGGSPALERGFAKLAPLGPLFLATFMVLGGIQHFVYSDFVATLVPAWIPNPMFWTCFAGVALIAGGIGLLVPRTARWAALMTGLMILSWVVLLHIPRALADPHQPAETSGVFEALAFSGIALMLASLRSGGTDRL